jgi:16S rRNA (uracil1498-N3)-methyltransferase
MADRFYVNSPLAPGPAVLQGPEAHHLATVLRAQPGTAVCLFNGDGAEYPAAITEVAKRAVAVEVGTPERPDRELPIQLEVAAPLPKGDRGDFLVEKLTELGVARFVPLRTRRSVVHPRIDRLQRAVIEASKQCGRNVLMEIAPVSEWDGYCNSPVSDAVRLLAHPSAPGPLPPRGGGLGWGAGPGPATGERRVLIAVGPEGGFTDEEVERARGAGWRVVSLGPRVLRVETAAVALAAYFAFNS